MRPGRQLAVLGLIFVVLYLLVFFAGASGDWKQRLEPKLGLDLVGGTRVTLEAKTLDGNPPPAASLERAREIIEARVNSRGVSEAEVVTEGDRNIVISLPGQNRDLSEIGAAAELRFRKVLKVTDGGGVIARPSPSASASPSPNGSASPSPSGSASPSASASASASPSPSEAASPDTGGQGGMAPTP